ncbi:hypothetical protein P4O66_001055 [Electrophorus voltai]|uniref:Uncharacterized protein n=1 Tax=Electrophorus voltai TaxID=2609070 RepID=A0AAD9DWB3_9TELE|nr:hypothetical protein P4O66_001055 [Electrophorus voltai]
MCFFSAQSRYNDFQSSEVDSVDSSNPVERPSLILASLHGSTTGEEPTGQYWAGHGYGLGLDSAESYRDQLDYENRHSEVDSAGSYDPYMNYNEGYAEYGEECSDVSLRTDLEFDRGEEPAMEVEEGLRRGPPSVIDTESADSRSEEPPAPKRLPKAPPRRCGLGAGKLSHAA